MIYNIHRMLSIRETLKPYIIAYIIISLSIWYLKPNIMFHPDGTLKEFGTGYNKTIFYYPIVNIFTAMILFYIHQLLENIGSSINS